MASSFLLNNNENQNTTATEAEFQSIWCADKLRVVFCILCSWAGSFSFPFYPIRSLALLISCDVVVDDDVVFLCVSLIKLMSCVLFLFSYSCLSFWILLSCIFCWCVALYTIATTPYRPQVCIHCVCVCIQKRTIKNKYFFFYFTSLIFLFWSMLLLLLLLLWLRQFYTKDIMFRTIWFICIENTHFLCVCLLRVLRFSISDVIFGFALFSVLLAKWINISALIFSVL